MRKLLTIFLAFSLLITVFTLNTFADEEGGTNNNEDPIFNIVQSETGDIKINLKADQPNDSYNLEDINRVHFDCWENGMQYYYTFDTNSLIFLNGEVIIYYKDIEPSNLKAGKNYDVCIYFDDGTNYTLEQKFYLTTGSKRKDIPNYTASQSEEGDILLSFEDSDFPKLVNRITIQNHEITKYVYVSDENFQLSDDGKNIVIPASYVKKTQLVAGEYDIHLEYENQNSDTSEYFECQPNVTIDISVGSELSGLPEYSISQKDNGDIVISSENSEFISLINDIWYYPLSNQRAGGSGYYLSEDEYIKESNSITVPYSTVLLSNFKSNTNHSFTISLSSNEVFKYDYEDLNKEVMIYKGSILEDISVEQTDGGDIVFTFDDDSLASTIFEVLETIKIQHDSENGHYGAYVDKEYIKLIDNKIVISHDYVEESNLKANLEYIVYFNFLHELPNRLNISKGTTKKDLIIDSIIQDDDGNLVITTQDENFINKVSEIGLNNIDNTLNVSFSSKDMVRSSNTVTIPYETIIKSQLVEGRYTIYFWYNRLYDEYINFQQKDYLIISKGSKLSEFPAYSVSQNDNGDIIVESESKELIDHIKSIGYSKTDTRAGGYLPFTSFIKSDNKLVIPYQSVKYSSLEPDNTYVFSLQLDDDSIFLYDETLNKEVYIKIGSILTNLETMSIGTEYNVISINFDDQDYLKKLEDGTYSLAYYVWDSIEKENIISKDSIVFDYSENKIYLTNEFLAEKDYILSLMEKETYVAYGVAYIFGVPLVETEKANEKLDLDKMKADSTSYLERLYPGKRITVDSVYVTYSYDVLDTDADKYFKVYGLSPNNAFVIDVSMYANYKIGASWRYETVPYDYQDNPVTLELSFNLDQMAKLGITNDNYRSQAVSVLREHNGEVDELAATIEPVTVNGTIISFKVTFETDKMSLFALANKNSIVRPSSGGSDSGSSSTITIPAKKPVVNTSAK